MHDKFIIAKGAPEPFFYRFFNYQNIVHFYLNEFNPTLNSSPSFAAVLIEKC